MTIDDQGRIGFERDSRILLRSVSPGFVVSNGVEDHAVKLLSSHTHEGELTVTYGTCDPDAPMTLRAKSSPSGFCLRWSLPAKAGRSAVGVAWELEPQGPWYGQGERVLQPWPLDRLPVVADPLMPHDFGRDGSLCIVTPLWYHAAGAAILAHEDSGELEVNLGPGGYRNTNGTLHIAARLPESPTGGSLDAPSPEAGPLLALDILLADDIPGAHTLAINALGHPATAPPQEMIARPIWTTWARYKMAVTQEDVLRFAEEIAGHHYPRSVMEIDDRWQAAYGEAGWDRAKFPDPALMIRRLHELGFKVTLWVPPFFEPGSPSFIEAADRGYLVRHPADGSPAIVRWWQGYGGLIDVTNRAALDWWRGRLGRLQDEYGVDGFKFDAGEGNYVPVDRVTALPLMRRRYADHYVAWVAENFVWTEVRAGWRSQRQGILFREWDKASHWGLDNGLHSVLTQALALNMIGYPFVLPDMIGGNAYGDEFPDAELFVRWTQLTALLPAMQFSIPPWAFGDTTDAICRRYTLLHEELAPYIRSQIDKTVRAGVPLVRPIFWNSPHDRAVLSVDDQFLLGDALLVAPVLLPGQPARNVYLPDGQWRDRSTGAVTAGPRMLEGYSASLDILPLFERIDPDSG